MMGLRTTSEVRKMAARPEGSQVVIEMWAELGCPWCYLGKHRLRAAIAQRPDAERFKIVPRSFELDPQYANDQDRGFEFFSAVQDGFFAGALNPFDPDA